jgi:hypothetical protein
MNEGIGSWSVTGNNGELALTKVNLMNASTFEDWLSQSLAINLNVTVRIRPSMPSQA